MLYPLNIHKYICQLFLQNVKKKEKEIVSESRIEFVQEKSRQSALDRERESKPWFIQVIYAAEVISSYFYTKFLNTSDRSEWQTGWATDVEHNNNNSKNSPE